MAHELDSDFIREETSIDSNFSIVRNEWIRDARIAGNPLSVYLFIRSHSQGFRVTRKSIMAGLGIGRDALESAVAKLEKAGYLERVISRWPAGAKTATGKQLGGAKRVQYRLLEPQPDDAAQSAQAPDADAPSAPPARVPHQQAEPEPKAENPHRVIHREKPKAENPHRVIHTSMQAHQPKAENPMLGFPHHKEDQYKENQSSSGTGDVTCDSSAKNDDDDSKSSIERVTEASSAGEVVEGVDLDQLHELVVQRLGVELAAGIDLAAAVRGVLRRSRQVPVHPAQFVAAAIVRNPAEFAAASPVLDQVDARGATTAASSAGVSRCRQHGHHWVMRDGDRVCSRCDVAASSIVPEKREACAAMGHRMTTSEVCVICGHDEHAARKQREAQARLRCRAKGHRWGTPMPATFAGYHQGDQACDVPGCTAVRRDHRVGVLIVGEAGRVWVEGDPAAASIAEAG